VQPSWLVGGYEMPLHFDEALTRTCASSNSYLVSFLCSTAMSGMSDIVQSAALDLMTA
jgi:hypothetical protein